MSAGTASSPGVVARRVAHLVEEIRLRGVFGVVLMLIAPAIAL